MGWVTRDRRTQRGETEGWTYVEERPPLWLRSIDLQSCRCGARKGKSRRGIEDVRWRAGAEHVVDTTRVRYIYDIVESSPPFLSQDTKKSLVASLFPRALETESQRVDAERPTSDARCPECRCTTFVDETRHLGPAAGLPAPSVLRGRGMENFRGQ